LKVANLERVFSRDAAVTVMVEMWKNGELAKGDGTSDESEIRSYCSSLISNWLKRDPRLEGFTVEGAVTRTRSTGAPRSTKARKEKAQVDEQMKKLVAAKAILVKGNLPTDDVDALIAARQAELDQLRSNKAQEVMSKLKADLASLNIQLDDTSGGDGDAAIG
jgi:hypothetical protein